MTDGNVEMDLGGAWRMVITIRHVRITRILDHHSTRAEKGRNTDKLEEYRIWMVGSGEEWTVI